MDNSFWIAGNIIFDLETGKTTEVLMLVDYEENATTFDQGNVETVLSFVQRRATKIEWSTVPSSKEPQKFVIRGVQKSSGAK